MELTSSHWSFDPKTFAIDPDLSALLDLRLDLYDETNLEALNAGLWWVYPIGRNYASHLIGLRLSPGTPLAQSPVVIAKGGAVVTLCSRPAALVPALLFVKMASGVEQWNEVRSLSAPEWEAAVALHRALGGEGDLQDVKALAADRSLAAHFDDGSAYADNMRARAAGFARLDAQPQTAAYYAYAAEAAVEKTTAKAMPDVGPWGAAVAALAFVAARHERAPEGARELELAAARQLQQEPPALDTSRRTAGLTMSPSIHLSKELGISAAKVVVKRQHPEWASDPRMPAITALATTDGYDGTAHLEAAAKLAAAGDAGGAFTALTAAAYWSFHAEGKAKPEALERAIELVRGAGIGDLGDALEQQRHAHQAILAQVAREQPEDEEAGDEDSE